MWLSLSHFLKRIYKNANDQVASLLFKGMKLFCGYCAVSPYPLKYINEPDQHWEDVEVYN